MIRTAALLTALLAGPVLAPGPSPAGTVQPTALAPRRYQNQGFEATNRVRRHHARVRLSSQDCVQRFAERQARRMARQDRMFHQDLRPVLRRCRLTTAGENVAYGYPSGTSVVNEGWMHSAEHRESILRRQFRVLGMGARQSADGTWYAAQVFGGRTR